MWNFFINNYGVVFGTTCFGSLGLLWGYFGVYRSKRNNASKKTIFIHCFIAIAISMPLSILLGNYQHLNEKIEIIKQTRNYSQGLVVKLANTRKSWLNGVWKPEAYPYGPSPLTLESHDLSKMINDFLNLNIMIKKYFSPAVNDYSAGFGYMISSPQLSFFRIKNDDGQGAVVGESGYTNKQVRFLKIILQMCIAEMEREAKLSYIPILKRGSLKQLNAPHFPLNEIENIPFWFQIAIIASIERLNSQDKYFSTIVQGIAVFLIGDERSAVILLEEAIKLAGNDNVRKAQSDYYPLACLMLYKYHFYGAVIQGSPDVEKGQKYLALGKAANEKRFDELYSYFEEHSYFDPDMEWQKQVAVKNENVAHIK